MDFWKVFILVLWRLKMQEAFGWIKKLFCRRILPAPWDLKIIL
jgi:hypothetical protein